MLAVTPMRSPAEYRTWAGFKIRTPFILTIVCFRRGILKGINDSTMSDDLVFIFII